MKYTIRTALVVTASVLVLGVGGCHSGGPGQTVTVNGEHGKVYNGTAAQVSNQMGQDYGAGLRNMAARQAGARP